MNHKLLLLFGLAVAGLPACKKDKPTDSSGGGSSAGGTSGGATGGSPKVDTSKLGAECKMSFDCARLDIDADCSFECEKPSGDDSQPGYCQLRNVVATVGATSCYGNRIGVERSGSVPTEKTPTLNYCDLNAGVYCDMSSHTCVAIKAIDASCEDSAECGKDGACQDKKCVAAGAPGAAPVSGRCASTAYRKGDQCISRVADGGTCEESDQCQSLYCLHDGKTKACAPSKKKACAL